MARISAAADARGMTQEGLARAAGISQPQVSRLLAGKKPVTLTELLPLLESVGLRLSEVADDLGL